LPQGWVSEWETFSVPGKEDTLFAGFHHREPWQSPTALVVLHGLGEHGGRYLHLPHYLQDVVGAVYCMDFRGHGRSMGLRGHIESFRVFCDDAAFCIRSLHERLKLQVGDKAELHLFAHSMGGLIALMTLAAHKDLPLASVILSSPLLGIRVEVPLVKKAAARVLARAWGTLQLKSLLDPGDFSHDPAVAEAYLADRLVHKKLTLQFFEEMEKAIEWTLRRRSLGGIPAQFLIPERDRVVSTRVTEQFFARLKGGDKELKVYPDFYHEIVNEVGKEIVFEDMKRWIKQHSAGN